MKVRSVNPQLCSGCRMCEVACSFHHHGVFRPAVANIQVVTIKKAGLHFPIVCEQCEKAPCQEVCPVNAITRDETTGAWIIQAEKCIGCRTCANSCPLGAINFHPELRVSLKCDLCDGDPTCVSVCPMGAIEYIEEARISAKKKRLVASKMFRELWV